jgi:hypothetical protein
MASEDSDQFLSGFLAIHRLCKLGDVDEPAGAQMPSCLDDVQAPRESLEVILLSALEAIFPEERNDHFHEIPSTTHVVLNQMLTMVVVSPVHVQSADPEKALKLLEAGSTARTLRHDEPMEHLIADCVALSLRSTGLSNETD